MFDDDMPCLTCGKKTIINLDCDNHCIVPTCRDHFPEQQNTTGNGQKVNDVE